MNTAVSRTDCLQGRLAELARLRPGWHDGQGQGLDAEQLAWLAQSWHARDMQSLPQPFAYPTFEGGVLLEWDTPLHATSVEFARGRKVAQLLVVDLTCASAPALVDRFHDLSDDTAWAELANQLRPWVQHNASTLAA